MKYLIFITSIIFMNIFIVLNVNSDEFDEFDKELEADSKLIKMLCIREEDGHEIQYETNGKQLISNGIVREIGEDKNHNGEVISELKKKEGKNIFINTNFILDYKEFVDFEEKRAKVSGYILTCY